MVTDILSEGGERGESHIPEILVEFHALDFRYNAQRSSTGLEEGTKIFKQGILFG